MRFCRGVRRHGGGPGLQRIAMQCEMHCFGNHHPRQRSLKLGPGFKPLHWRQAFAQEQSRSQSLPKTSLDSQTLATFGAACSDDGAAAARFHAGQKTVGACALDFGRLVGAFHGKSCWPSRACYGPLSGKAARRRSNDSGELFNTAVLASLGNLANTCSGLRKIKATLRQQQAATNRENP